MKLINIKKFSIVLAIATLFCVMSFTTAFAEDVVTEPVTEPVATEPVYTEPKTEPETEPATEPETEPVTEQETEPETEPVTEPETEPVTEPVTEPETEPVTENYTEPTYDVNKLPTLVDSTQVAEELPTAIGADEDGGVSFVGGVVCWIAVIISACVIIAFLLSTKVKGKNMGKFKRYQ